MPLKTRRLGRTGHMVTGIGLGGYQFTGEFGVHYDEADKILDLAIDGGINFIDTAQMYGFGEGEALVGRSLRRRPDRRIIISDKVGYVDRGVARAAGEDGYRDPVSLRRMIKHSMWLLQRDHVEIFMVHEPDAAYWGFDYETGEAAVTSALEDLKKEGVIGALGLGCWNSEILARLCGSGRFDVALNAGGVTLLDSPMFKNLTRVAGERDIGIIVGGVLGQGSAELIEMDYAKVNGYLNDPDGTKRARGKKLLRLYELSDRAGMTMPEMALRYVLGFDEIHCHIPGARRVEHLAENLAAYERGKLPRDLTEEIIKVREMTGEM